MAKVKIEIVVEVEKVAGEYALLNVRVGDNQTAPLPPDAPAPRRLVKNLVEAAVASGRLK
jgi:hypothetical protein